MPRARREQAADVKREKILRVVCKYINSGFPVVVLTGDPARHAFVLVGWQKRAGRIELIACDDQVGPYEVITDPLLEPPGGRGRWRTLMMPLPEKVFLTGEAAEGNGRAIVETTAARYRALTPTGAPDTQSNDLAKIAAGLTHLRGPVSVRARLMEGRRWKAGLVKQGRSDAILRLFRLSHLPHWVWLLEFHDRAARQAGTPCVIGEIVFDSTSHDDLPTPRLLATTSVAIDLTMEASGAPEALSQASGDGTAWRSVISDWSLADDEYPSTGATRDPARAAFRLEQ
jgi:hypothetical protein